MNEGEFLIQTRQAEEEISNAIWRYEETTGAKINDIRITPHGNIKEEGGVKNIVMIGINIPKI
jgi:hypothetical protein